MRQEIASIRRLLEHQVSGLMWQEVERREPVRAMLIKHLNGLGFSDGFADQLAMMVCISIASFALGLVMLWLERHIIYLSANLQTFAMPVESARQVLSVIAGSIISVGGVSFSVTMVALTLTSGQYGPKILRHFLEDNSSKVSLGLFLGTYIYALVVLTGYSEADKPHLTVLMALLLALFSKPS